LNIPGDGDSVKRVVVVVLREDDLHSIKFACQAEDPEHAQEQAENAYPAATVLSVVEADLEASGATGTN
jgi:hypothetical protein